MLQEQNFDFMAWWNEQSFPGKELYKIDGTGELVLRANNNIKERTIAQVSPENADAVIKNLQEKFAAVESRMRELEIEWVAAEDKLKLADKVAQVKEYLYQASAIGDFERLALLVHDWEHTLYVLSEENYAAKLKLTELAESVAQGDNWKETTQALKDIADKWKQAGYVDRHRNDKLWNRIEAARKAFHERKRLHHTEEEKDLLHNMDLKIDLVEQAEGIAKSEDWKKTTETFHRLTEEWKTIGHTVNKKNEELWQRFQAAKSVFFDQKRIHFQKVQQEQEKNFALKEALVEKAEALKESKDWNVTAQAYAALMDEWKKTGRISHEKGDDLWKRFTAAQDVFFEAKKQHLDEVRAVHEHNYSVKKDLLDRAERLKHSTRWADATAEMQQLLEDWKKTGPVSRALGDKMWEDFNAARKHFFERKDASREQRKQEFEEQKVVRAEQARGQVQKMKEELKEEEEKLADFKVAIENITPGKKAAELRKHLETLIAETTVKLKRMQDKFAQVERDSRVAEPQDAGQGNTAGSVSELPGT